MDSNKYTKVVLCETEDEAKELLKLWRMDGYRWAGGIDLSSMTNWSVFSHTVGRRAYFLRCDGVVLIGSEGSGMAAVANSGVPIIMFSEMQCEDFTPCSEDDLVRFLSV